MKKYEYSSNSNLILYWFNCYFIKKLEISLLLSNICKIKLFQISIFKFNCLYFALFPEIANWNTRQIAAQANHDYCASTYPQIALIIFALEKEPLNLFLGLKCGICLGVCMYTLTDKLINAVKLGSIYLAHLYLFSPGSILLILFRSCPFEYLVFLCWPS